MVKLWTDPSRRLGGLLRSPAVLAGDLDQKDTTLAAPPVDRAARRNARLRALVAYILARLCVVAGAAGVSTARDVTERLNDPSKLPPDSAVGGILNVLNSWDGQWYYTIIRTGYPRKVPPNVTFEVLEARAAFFPLYPFTVRIVDRVIPGGDVPAALVLNGVLGFVSVLLVGLLAAHLYDEQVAERAMILTALFPGSFVLSFAYSEAIMFVLVAICLYALVRHRWLVAGVAAALVTASRPNGVAICVACAVASGLAIRDRREWRSLIAPVLSPIGWVAFQIGLSRHTGERGVWFRVQREAWGEGLSFGMTALDGIGNALVHPLSSPGNLLTLTTVATMGVMVYASWRMRLNLTVAAYCAAVLALMLLPSTVAPRPRFLFTAFPLLIGVAAWWKPRWNDAWTLLMVSCGAGLVALPVMYGGFAAIP